MISFRWRLQIVLFAWLVVALILLSLDVGVAWAVGGSAAIYGGSFGLAEFLTWVGK